MEVILREAVNGLGREGDIVQVKPGYARNYLLPNGIASLTASTDARKVEHQRRLLADKQKRELKTTTDLAKRIEAQEIRIPARTGEEDRVFGSVTTADISEALAKAGIEVDRRKIVIEEPIRALGVYTIPIRLTGEITADMKLWVVKQERE
ncbi:MAG TPA: 50S ribosomal protein L9 [bacterium]|nr:50S ribosomal protein L9 [bacterium]